MKKTFIILIIFTSFVFCFGSCNDPIFFYVSEETKQNDPRISGSPTKFVEYDGFMWVASGKRLYNYKDGIWNLTRFDNWISDIAATENNFYICFESGGAKTRFIRQFEQPQNKIYADIQLPQSAQTIHVVNKILFLSAEKNNNYSIYYFDDEVMTEPELLSTGDYTPSVILGAAYDGTYYYLCTSSGIVCADNQFKGSLIQGSSTFKGIINLNNTTVAAITRGSSSNVALHIIKEDGIGTSVATFPKSDHKSSGALAVCIKEGKSILLAGRQESLVYTTTTGYTYGYMELLLDEDKNPINNTFNEPGRAPTPPTSIEGSYDQFISSLGKNPVNHLFQSSDGILFASTQQRGVWSYRERDGNWQWNAEE